jgi:DNA-binding ferritin-like protein
MLSKDLIQELFQIRTIAHTLHLETRSFSQHKALNEFYDEILELTDTLAESLQGLDEYDTLQIVGDDAPEIKDDEPKAFITSVQEWATWVRNEIPEELTFVTSQWDDILTLIDQTRYKILKLK